MIKSMHYDIFYQLWLDNTVDLKHRRVDWPMLQTGRHVEINFNSV